MDVIKSANHATTTIHKYNRKTNLWGLIMISIWPVGYRSLVISTNEMIVVGRYINNCWQDTNEVGIVKFKLHVHNVYVNYTNFFYNHNLYNLHAQLCYRHHI